MQPEDLSFHQIAPKTIAISLKNSAFSLNYVEEVFRQNEVMNTTIQQFGEALVTLRQRVEKESSERLLWREKFEKEQERVLQLEEQVKILQTKLESHQHIQVRSEPSSLNSSTSSPRNEKTKDAEIEKAYSKVKL